MTKENREKMIRQKFKEEKLDEVEKRQAKFKEEYGVEVIMEEEKTGEEEEKKEETPEETKSE